MKRIKGNMTQLYFNEPHPASEEKLLPHLDAIKLCSSVAKKHLCLCFECFITAWL